MSGFKAEQISANVWWVGAVDWNVRNFHGYLTSRGTTYNAFLIIDEKITLVDTVKAPFFDEMMARVASVVDPARIDYIVSNHSEPDHSGALPAAAAVIKPEKIFASTIGAKTLAAYFGSDLEITPVASGSSISLGAGNLAFVDTKMLHWPDSMISYYDRDKVLFSQDAFGMHLAGSKRWAADYDKTILEYETRKYFANILNFQAKKVVDLLDSLPGLGLDIQIILPDHGPLWAGDRQWIIDLYRDAAMQRPRPKALIAYATMWNSTRKMADLLAEGINSAGVETVVIDLAVSERSAIMTEVADCGLVAFGAPTVNNHMFPAMADVLSYVKGLKPANKIGFAFGSMGWSGEGAKEIAAAMTDMNWSQPAGIIQAKYMPTEEIAGKMIETGRMLGEELLKAVGENK